MHLLEDNIIILLRKILALAAPNHFEATEDTTMALIMEKLIETDIFLFDVVNDFLFPLTSLLEINNHPNDSQYSKETIDSLTLLLITNTAILKKECKSLHINIDYELEQIYNNGNIIEK